MALQHVSQTLTECYRPYVPGMRISSQYLNTHADPSQHHYMSMAVASSTLACVLQASGVFVVCHDVAEEQLSYWKLECTQVDASCL